MNRTIETHPGRPETVLIVDWDTGLAYPFARNEVDDATLRLVSVEEDLTHYSSDDDAYEAIHDWLTYGKAPYEKLPSGTVEPIRYLLDKYLYIDGEHHKQWLLERIADIVGVPHENEGIAP